MFLKGGTIHHDVVQVHDDKVVKEVLENLIYKSTKHDPCVSEAKWYDKEFEGSVLGYACSLRLVSFSGPNLAVPRMQVEFGIVPRFAKLVKEICYQQYLMLALNSNLVERSIVDRNL